MCWCLSPSLSVWVKQILNKSQLLCDSVKKNVSHWPSVLVSQFTNILTLIDWFPMYNSAILRWVPPLYVLLSVRLSVHHKLCLWVLFVPPVCVFCLSPLFVGFVCPPPLFVSYARVFCLPCVPVSPCLSVWDTKTWGHWDTVTLGDQDIFSSFSIKNFLGIKSKSSESLKETKTWDGKFHTWFCTCDISFTILTVIMYISPMGSFILKSQDFSKNLKLIL